MSSEIVVGVGVVPAAPIFLPRGARGGAATGVAPGGVGRGAGRWGAEQLPVVRESRSEQLPVESPTRSKLWQPNKNAGGCSLRTKPWPTSSTQSLKDWMAWTMDSCRNFHRTRHCSDGLNRCFNRD